MSWYTLKDAETILLKVYVQPRASKNELAGLHDEAIKLRLTTPPVDGKANKAVITFFAKLFKVPKTSIAIKSGLKNRNKTILIHGVGEEELFELLRLTEECSQETD